MRLPEKPIMTLHFHWLHAPHRLTGIPVNRATTLVLGIIGVSLLFGVLRVLDVAAAGAAAQAASSVAASAVSPLLTVTDPAIGAAAPVEADLVEVPDATADAVSL